MRDIFQNLCIHGYLAKQPPFLLYLAQVSFAFVSASAFLDKAIVVKYSSDSFVAAGKIMFSFQSLWTLEGELLSELNNFLFKLWRCFVWTM